VVRLAPGASSDTEHVTVYGYVHITEARLF